MRENSTPKAPDLDEIDREILRKLQRHGRARNVEIASGILLSASATLRRINRLEDCGVIAGYVAILDRTAIGRPMTVFTSITLVSQQEQVLDEFEQAIHSVPEVMSCHLMAGEADYLVEIACRDVPHYELIHRLRLANLPSVSKIHSNFAIRTVARRTAFNFESTDSKVD